MRTIFHYLNTTFVITTILLTLLYGEKSLAAYFLLGIFQLLSGLIILLISIFKIPFFKEIFIYWLLVIVYFTIVNNLFSNEMIRFTIIPVTIAIYNCYMTFKLQNI